MTFPELPPVDSKGFWSITLYNKNHFFAPNEIDRFSLGAKSKQLPYEADGSLGFPMQSKVIVVPAGKEMSGTLPGGGKGLIYKMRQGPHL